MDTAQVLAFSLVMLNTDAHNDAIRKDRKMTLQQYKNNLRGICKDGSSPDPKMLEAMYVGICRFPWQVEEREHVVKVREGWLHKVSSNTSGKVLSSQRRKYCVLSSRALYLFKVRVRDRVRVRVRVSVRVRVRIRVRVRVSES